MANHASALKRHRQSQKRRDRNRTIKSSIRTAIKGAKADIEEGKLAEAKESLRAAERMLAKAAGKGIVPKRAARRSVSRLAKKYNGATKKNKK